MKGNRGSEVTDCNGWKLCSHPFGIVLFATSRGSSSPDTGTGRHTDRDTRRRKDTARSPEEAAVVRSPEAEEHTRSPDTLHSLEADNHRAVAAESPKR
jgi:hypothetical protein